MTELDLRRKVVETIRGWVGAKKGDETHKRILAVYNAYRPLPRGHVMTVSDNWCAATVSAAYILNGMAEYSGVECSCGAWIEIAKKKGIWVENDAHIPQIGDAVIYAWNDKADYATTDNKTGHNHVGIITAVGASRFAVTEGNFSGGVNLRGVEFNGRYIRGFICPDYAAAAKAMTETEDEEVITLHPDMLKRGSKGYQVRQVQRLLVCMGYSAGTADGIFGTRTEDALKDYQKDHGLTADGVCGQKTWEALLGIE